MGITTTTTLPAPLQKSFSMKLLSVPTSDLIYSIPADMKLMPKNGGRSLRMRRNNKLNTAPVPLGNSGLHPAPQVMTAVNIDATIEFYGTYLYINEQVELQAQDPVLNEATELLGISLRETEDELMRDMLIATATFINSVDGTNADLPTEITREDCDHVIRTMRGNDARTFLTGIEGENNYGTAPVRDAFFGLGHTDMIGQLDAVNGFTQKWNYPQQGSTLPSEWGTIANIRFLLSSNGSITAAASLLGETVYNTFICGREGFAGVEQNGYSSQFIYRDPMYDGPLALNCSLGYKFATVPTLLNDAWVVNLRSTLA